MPNVLSLLLYKHDKGNGGDAMLSLGSSFNYYFCAEPVTLRYRHKGLRHYIKSQLHRDPTNGDIYIFLSKECKRVRLYYYHHQGGNWMTANLPSATMSANCRCARLPSTATRAISLGV